MIDWPDVDHVLLDMDGTLLDLHYDNVIWNTLLAERYADAQDISTQDARESLFSHMRDVHGQLDFYCLDHWAQRTGLDIIAIHQEVSHLIEWRPGAQNFLAKLATRGIPKLLVTNAHHGSIGIKHEHTGVLSDMDAVVSAHDYGAPKEDPAFWRRLQTEHGINPSRALFIDDNRNVLDAAQDFGIGQLLTVASPDSNKPLRQNLTYPSFDHFDELLA